MVEENHKSTLDSLEILFNKLLDHVGRADSFNPEELRQLDEDALMQYAMDLMLKTQEVHELLAPLVAITGKLKYEAKSYSEQKSIVQSILRTLRDRA
jgi:hypothetical protein